MANFKVYEEQWPVHYHGKQPVTAMWNINNREDADEPCLFGIIELQRLLIGMDYTPCYKTVLL